jgi:hypothetical protein
MQKVDPNIIAGMIIAYGVLSLILQLIKEMIRCYPKDNE